MIFDHYLYGIIIFFAGIAVPFIFEHRKKTFNYGPVLINSVFCYVWLGSMLGGTGKYDSEYG